MCTCKCVMKKNRKDAQKAYNIFAIIFFYWLLLIILSLFYVCTIIIVLLNFYKGKILFSHSSKSWINREIFKIFETHGVAAFSIFGKSYFILQRNGIVQQALWKKYKVSFG